MATSTVKAVIVEDEPPMGRFIKKSIENEGIFVCCVCENTEMALSKLKKYDADLLITDICMPGCSGLELIKEAKKINQNLQFIIISGYRDFAYAKEAISLGVDDYLTKPIQLEELHNSLTKISKKIISRKFFSKSQKLAEAFIYRDNLSLSSLFPWKYCSVYAFYRSGYSQNLIDPKWLEKSNENTEIFQYLNIVLFLIGRTNRNYESNNSFPLSVEDIFKTSNRNTCTFLCVEEIRSDNMLYESLDSVIQRIHMCTVFGETKSVSIKTLDENIPFLQPQDTEILNNLIAEISAKSTSKISNLVTQLFSVWKESGTQLYYMRRKILKICDLMEKEFFHQSEHPRIREIFSDIFFRADSYDECCSTIVSAISKTIDAYSINEENAHLRSQSKDFLMFQKIKNLLDENPDKNYTLQEIGHIFNLSQPYIRKIFKKYSSLPYKEYILKNKIEIAKQIMEANPDVLVKEVASCIGFEQLYFTTIFRKYVGINPTTYKKGLENSSFSDQENM